MDTATANTSLHGLVRIAWNNATIGEWQAVLAVAGKSSLSQSFAHAQALVRTERRRTEAGLILINEEPVGIVTGIHRRVMGLARHTTIHRGPILIPDARRPDVTAAALQAIRKHWPAGILRWTTFIPELPMTPESIELLHRAGFRPTSDPGCRTLWLDLSQDTDRLRRRLHHNWRHGLATAERAEIANKFTVSIDPQARRLPELVQRCLVDRQSRNYHGPSGPMLIRLRNALAPESGAILALAEGDGHLTAGILVLVHGSTATWQCAWAGLEGRQTNAIRLLLWRVILFLKTAGVSWFDLGGIDPLHAAGVAAFKRGMGAEEVELVGTWV